MFESILNKVEYYKPELLKKTSQRNIEIFSRALRAKIYGNETYVEIGADYRLTKFAVSRIYKAVLKKLDDLTRFTGTDKLTSR